MSIRQKFVFYTLGIILLVGGGISLYFSIEGKRRILEDFDSESRRVSIALASTIASDLYFLDASSLRDRLRNARMTSAMSHAYVTDTNGVVLADGTSANAHRDQKLADHFSERVLQADGWVSSTDGATLKVGGPVFMPDGTRSGYLQAGFPLDETHELIRHTTLGNLYLTLFSLAVGGILAFLVGTILSRPLLPLMQAAKEIGKGKFDTRVSVERSDELGTLAESVNLMAEGLQARDDEIRRTEEVLRADREQFRLLVESTHAIPWEADAKTWAFSYVSPQAATLLGYPVDRWYEKDFWVSCIHPEDRDPTTERCRSTSRSQDVYELEYRMLASDGKIIWVHDVVSVVREQGEPKTLRGIIIDITQRKQAEEALRESETQMRLVTDSLPAVIAYVDVEQRYQFNNAAYEKYLGVPLEQITGRTIKETLGEVAYKSIRPNIESALAGNEVSYELKMQFPVVGSRHFQVNLVPRLGQDGTAEGVYVLALDTTDRKVVEAALEKQRTLLRQVIDIDPNLIFAKDREGRFTLVNQAVADAYGTTVDNLVGKTDADFNSNAEEIAYFRKIDLEVMDTLQETFIKEETITDATGTKRWLQTVKRPIVDESGKAMQVLGSASDITQRKQAEEALAERLRFETLVAQLSTGFINMPADSVEQEIDHALESLGEFFDVDRVSLVEVTIDGKDFIDRRRWESGRWDRKRRLYADVSRTPLPEIWRRGEAFAFDKPEDLPAEPAWAYAREVWIEGGVRSLVAVPVHVSDELVGAVCFALFLREHVWPAEVVQKFRLVGEIFANALLRKRVETALQESERALRTSETELQKLAGDLLAAQEAERRSLARDLHDDLTQRLAALSMDIASIEGQKNLSIKSVRGQLDEVRTKIAELTSDVHGVARRLHPSVIDDLGLVKALRSECNSFSHREGIAVEFKHRRVPRSLPKDLSLSLYRIAQEGLRNVAKHSTSRDATIELAAVNGEISLAIRDRGIGFSAAEVQGRGLGLISMRERARLNGGVVAVDSAPGKGTTIEIRVPLRPKAQ